MNRNTKMSTEKNENPKAFKHLINENVAKKIALAIGATYQKFDRNHFLTVIDGLAPLELKARVHLIREQLHKTLPSDYLQALEILTKSVKYQPLKGFELWPYTEFIQTHGLNHPQPSLKALYTFTQLFTAEFAVRPFLRQHSKATLSFLAKCAKDKNVHVRRWASEGSRPRLPWGEKLQHHIENPETTLKILESLKYDDELYVRKSVANHLNDISKDNPEVAILILKRWKKKATKNQASKIDWITRHALRSLIKAGNPRALQLIGANTNAKVKLSNFQIKKKVLRINENLEFQFSLQSESRQTEFFIVDYAINFVGANKKLSRKVFKLKKVKLAQKEKITIQKRHSLKPITTRRYNSGRHEIEIQVNGRVCAKLDWLFKI